jgi:peptide/nickel transport system ATP-binding protein
MSALLRVRDLAVHFQARTGLLRSTTVRAVDGVSLAIERGETVGLVGESGSGKTTLARAILRLVEPASGRIWFEEQEVTRLRGVRLRRLRRGAQMVSQDPYASISPYMDVREIVEEPLFVHGVGGAGRREELVRRALETVKLLPTDEIASKYPHNLSGGQRQRVSVARAIVLSPRLVVADEPVSMVDASNRAEILSLLRELQSTQGMAFLYITHDIASARYFSDRIAVLYLGSVAESGPTAEVLGNPKHPYTVALMASVPEPDPANRARLRKTIAGEPPRADAIPSGCPFHPRCPSFIEGLCEVRPAEMREVSPGHLVACHLYD